MESTTEENKDVDSNWRGRVYRSLCYLGLALGVIGCGTIKKAGVVATAAGTGAVAGTVLSGGVIAPIAGSMTSAFVADVVTEVTGSSRTTMDSGSCAPDNFWSLLGSMAEMGGWLLILVVIIPMVLGWFLPGPVKMKGREPKHPNPLMR
tara:strand:- start:1677 stop:2123 length:447 start_codon:yes stop_codon:yes gene_type:complete